MKRDYWKDLVEGIGFLAIVASLVFVGIERGAIDEDRLRSVLKPLNLGNSMVQEFWNRNQDNFTKGYRDYLNGLIAERDVSE